MKSLPLNYKIIAKCSTTKARTGIMTLPHAEVPVPIFMPVGTAGSMKGVAPEQLEEIDCRILLANTYHLSLQPGEQLLRDVGGLHKFMRWNRAMLTDSGGFQMVSLLELSQVTEEGVWFSSPYDGSWMLLTPERSIEIQNAIGADIMMQLDDVVSSKLTGPRVEEAMWRSIRWLDRCLAANQRPHEQNLFPIIQGGLDMRLREICVREMIKRDASGFAIGGLSGGESKDDFWRIVSQCTDLLPENKPRYCMGVGYAEDLVVCSALGVDMYDCVFPTRTARFGNALTRQGPLYLKKTKYMEDYTPIEEDCTCPSCKTHSRATVFKLLESNEAVACHLLSIHNIAFQLRLMKDIRESIKEDRFPEFVKRFMYRYFKQTAEPSFMNRFHQDISSTQPTKSKSSFKNNDMQDGDAIEVVKEDSFDPGKALSEKGYPIWIENALASVGITLNP